MIIKLLLMVLHSTIIDQNADFTTCLSLRNFTSCRRYLTLGLEQKIVISFSTRFFSTFLNSRYFLKFVLGKFTKNPEKLPKKAKETKK